MVGLRGVSDAYNSVVECQNLALVVMGGATFGEKQNISVQEQEPVQVDGRLHQSSNKERERFL